MDQSSVFFVADRMLGRLARMLRLLGYDAEYSADMTTAQLRDVAKRGKRIVLTRGQAEKRYPDLTNVYSVQSEHPPDRLREVVERFKLDTRAGLWTRCTLCNGMIEKAEKASVQAVVPSKIFEVYEEFFRCAACGHVYWRGSHVERVLKNLATLLGEKPG